MTTADPQSVTHVPPAVVGYVQGLEERVSSTENAVRFLFFLIGVQALAELLLPKGPAT